MSEETTTTQPPAPKKLQEPVQAEKPQEPTEFKPKPGREGQTHEDLLAGVARKIAEDEGIPLKAAAEKARAKVDAVKGTGN